MLQFLLGAALGAPLGGAFAKQLRPHYDRMLAPAFRFMRSEASHARSEWRASSSTIGGGRQRDSGSFRACRDEDPGKVGGTRFMG